MNKSLERVKLLAENLHLNYNEIEQILQIPKHTIYESQCGKAIISNRCESKLRSFKLNHK